MDFTVFREAWLFELERKSRYGAKHHTEPNIRCVQMPQKTSIPIQLSFSFPKVTQEELNVIVGIKRDDLSLFWTETRRNGTAYSIVRGDPGALVVSVWVYVGVRQQMFDARRLNWLTCRDECTCATFGLGTVRCMTTTNGGGGIRCLPEPIIFRIWQYTSRNGQSCSGSRL